MALYKKCIFYYTLYIYKYINQHHISMLVNGNKSERENTYDFLNYCTSHQFRENFYFHTWSLSLNNTLP